MRSRIVVRLSRRCLPFLAGVCGFSAAALACPDDPSAILLNAQQMDAPKAFAIVEPITVSQPFAVTLGFCDESVTIDDVEVDATMPAHRHGMNYQPEITAIDARVFKADKLVFHMPGDWQLAVTARIGPDVQNYFLDISVK